MCTSYLVGHLYCMLAKPSAKQMRKLQLIALSRSDFEEIDARRLIQSRLLFRAANGALLLVPVTLEEVKSREIEL